MEADFGWLPPLRDAAASLFEGLSRRVREGRKILRKPENLVQGNEGSLRRVANVGGVRFRRNRLVGTGSQ